MSRNSNALQAETLQRPKLLEQGTERRQEAKRLAAETLGGHGLRLGGTRRISFT